MKGAKPSFDFKKPFYYKFWNRLGKTNQLFYGLTATILFLSYGTMREGWNNNKFLVAQENWLKNEVRTSNSPRYLALDEEDPPVPLEPKTPEEIFRYQFARLRQ